jgi:hypothetical protein
MEYVLNAVKANGLQVSRASIPSILEEFGGDVENALISLNQYGCALEDLAANQANTLQRLEQVCQEFYDQLKEALGYLDFYQKREDQYVDLMTDPNQLSGYYLDLEHAYQEMVLPAGYYQRRGLPVPQVQERSPQQVQAPLQPGYQPQPGYQLQPQPQTAQFADSGSADAIAAQYAQSFNTGAPQYITQAPTRPVAPVMPVAGQGQEMSIQNIPPSQRWRYIDAVTQQGGFKGQRLSLG